MLLLIALIGIVVSYQRTISEQARRSELLLQGNVPVALLDITEFDWGEVSRGSPVEQDFILSNPSATELEITKIMTSCACTTAALWLDGAELGLPAQIPSQGTGIVRVIFDPDFMKSRGVVKRAVRIETNDPVNPFLIINLQANVR